MYYIRMDMGKLEDKLWDLNITPTCQNAQGTFWKISGKVIRDGGTGHMLLDSDF